MYKKEGVMQHTHSKEAPSLYAGRKGAARSGQVWPVFSDPSTLPIFFW